MGGKSPPLFLAGNEASYWKVRFALGKRQWAALTQALMAGLPLGTLVSASVLRWRPLQGLAGDPGGGDSIPSSPRSLWEGMACTATPGDPQHGGSVNRSRRS